MKKIAIVIGGSGFIGGFLIRDLLANKIFDEIYNFDLIQKNFNDSRVIFKEVDVRKEITENVGFFDSSSSWIYNLAALCREPGSESKEYFDTNVNGAENVVEYAISKGFKNILFTSTMSSFGRMEYPTTEKEKQYPETPYGISKLVAEKIHQIWFAKSISHRLIICRPSVIFGPGDNQNIPRLIGLIKKGIMIFPGDPKIIKSYGYVYGLIESFAFTIGMVNAKELIYHYAEEDCLSLEEMVNHISKFIDKKPILLKVPTEPLALVAASIQFFGSIVGFKSPIHPVRIRKLAFPTNLKPQFLIDSGFRFNFPFDRALEDWKSKAPNDWS